MAERKHILEFETEGMVVTIATDDLNELSTQGWFRQLVGRQMEFIGQREEPELLPPPPPVRVQQQPQQPPQQQQRMQMQDPFASPMMQRPAVQQPALQPPPRPDHMQISPNQMTPEIWSRLTQEQRQQWQAAWIPQQR